MVIPNQSEMEEHLLVVLYKLGGNAKTTEINERLTDKFPGLTKDDIDKISAGKTKVWENQIKFVRDSLIHKGQLIIEENGDLVITKEGLKRIGKDKKPESFNPIVYDEIFEIKKQLEDEGKILSEEELEKYYNTFKEKFGPQILIKLDGEDLLNTMHGPGYENLHYWLEFKDDEEFQGVLIIIDGCIRLM